MTVATNKKNSRPARGHKSGAKAMSVLQGWCRNKMLPDGQHANVEIKKTTGNFMNLVDFSSLTFET
ncbi:MULTISPECIES: hypothetical protein [Brucella]|nr:hypothetical protein [Brucella anthropi]AIK43211.1 hypothetical protein DR92_1972 [Brucella anthropi]KAB2746668.1 hypothetical protein F9K95_22005 [Brucella anthropi]MCQ9147085.1 hypothetical protein [Ochrobactrum sp. BTU2]MDH0366947.1 hypothetical protein [Brucella anthropi]